MTRELWEMEEFPVYLTFFATPGYDDSLRESYGISEEYNLFRGKEREENGTTHITWGTEDHSIQGGLQCSPSSFSISISRLYIEIEKLAQYHKPLICVFLEILKNTKLKPFEFDRGEMTYKLLNDKTHRWRSEKFSSLSEFHVKTTRSNFPSDKLTLNIGKMTRSKFVQWFTLLFQLSGKNDVDLILEDTKRKSFNFDMIDYFFHAFTYK